MLACNCTNYSPPSGVHPREATLPAIHLRDLLWLRKAKPTTTWVAITGAVDTGSCEFGFRSTRLYREHLGLSPIPVRPEVGPLYRGTTRRMVERVRTVRGTAEVRRTFGICYRKLMAELAPKVTL